MELLSAESSQNLIAHGMLARLHGTIRLHPIARLALDRHDPGPAPSFPDKATNKELGQMQQRFRMFELRQVWYSTDEIDLTGDLIKLLQVPLERDAPAKSAEPPKPPAKPERGGE